MPDSLDKSIQDFCETYGLDKDTFRELLEINSKNLLSSFDIVGKPFTEETKMIDPLDKFKVVCDETNNSQKDIEEGRINVDIYIYKHKNSHQITLHPEVYEVIENYKNYTPIQRFFCDIKWGFKYCLNNFRNWKGHIKGEDWDFWGILSGEESGYE